MRRHVEIAPELRDTAVGVALADPEVIFSAKGTVMVKDHPRTAVGRAVITGRAIYIKRFKGYAWYRRLETSVRGSVARRCRAMAEELVRLGFEVPRVLAIVECAAESWLVTEGRDDARPAGALWLERAEAWPLRERREALERGASFLRRFHDTGLYSRDTNANNFLITPDGDFLLLDLENVRRLPVVSPRRRIKNLVQFYRVVRGRLPAREALHFVAAYLRAGGDGRVMLRNWWPRLQNLDAAKEHEYRQRALAHRVDSRRGSARERTGKGTEG